MELQGGKVAFVERPPIHEHSNGNYAFSTETLRRSFASGMGQFHLHAVDGHFDSSWGAGPSGQTKKTHNHGSADLGAAESLGLDGVVITSIGPGKFNVDYYTPEGVVIDLGNYEYKNK